MNFIFLQALKTSKNMNFIFLLVPALVTCLSHITSKLIVNHISHQNSSTFYLKYTMPRKMRGKVRRNDDFLKMMTKFHFLQAKKNINFIFCKLKKPQKT